MLKILGLVAAKRVKISVGVLKGLHVTKEEMHTRILTPFWLRIGFNWK